MEVVRDFVGDKVKRAVVGFLLFGSLIPAQSSALATQSVMLVWNASSDPTVVGYKIYYGGASRAYTNAVDVGNATNATISGLIEGRTYYFAATAYNILGMESAFSAETAYTVPSNSPPTITSIPNQTIATNSSSGPIAFRVGDYETPAGSLILWPSTSAAALIPTNNILLGGSGSNRTVTLTPMSGQSGSANITITVNDGNASTNRTFKLTVLAKPPPPGRVRHGH